VELFYFFALLLCHVESSRACNSLSELKTTRMAPATG